MVQPTITIYLLTLLGVAFACLLRWVLDPWLGEFYPYVTFFPTVAALAWAGGARPALLATLICLPLSQWFFIPPRFSFFPDSLPHLIGMILFVVICLAFCFIGEALHRSRLRLLSAEARARSQEELYRITFASIGDGVITTDLDGTIVSMNPVAEKILGATLAECRGQSLYQLCALRYESGEPVDPHPLLRALQEQTPLLLQDSCILVRKDGQEVTIDDSASPIRNERGEMVGGVLVFRDVTDRKRAEQQLRDRTAIMNALADGTNDLLFVKDHTGRLKFANPATLRILGYKDLSEHFQNDNFVFGSAEEYEVIEANDQEVLRTGQALCVEEVFTGALGRRVYLAHKTPLLDHYGTVVGVIGVAQDITDRKQQQDWIQENERRFRLLCDSMPQIVYVSLPSGELEYLNPRWREYTGLETDNLNLAVHPEDLPGLVRRWGSALETGQPFEHDFRLRHQTGYYRWFLTRAMPIRDVNGFVQKWLGTSTDIHDQKEAAAIALQRSQQVQRQAEAAVKIASSPDISTILQLVADEARQLLRSRWAVAELLPAPHSPKPSRGVACAEGWPEVPPPHTIESGGSVLETLQVPFHDPTGTAFGFLEVLGPLEGSYTPDDRAILVQLAQMASIAMENLRLVESLRLADRRKDEFLATLAHELRNPLAPLRTGLQILQSATPDSSDWKSTRERMERQVALLVRLIDDLLDLSRVSRGVIHLQKKVFDLRVALDRALEISQPHYNEKNHRLFWTRPAEPLVVEADEARLTQVFANLLNNAARYTPAGGQIRIDIKSTEERVALHFHDNGIGIAPDMLPSIFEMFTQLDRTYEHAQGGLGIGLSLVKSLVHMHGGTIEAFSQGQGQGSEFVLTLPLSSATLPQESVAPMVASLTNGQRRILIADDNEDAALTLAMMLMLMGHEAETVSDGEAAVKRAANYRPDLVLLDLGMPVLDGYEACSRIRQEPWGKDMTLVALTGWGQEESRRRSRESGFDHHVIKPIDAAELCQLLRVPVLTSSSNKH
jgi:PAS domain S-box-containing protein